MSTFFEEITKCAVCGTEAEYTYMGSSSGCGYADLDTRPPELERSTMFTWVHRCPGCGYCAEDVSEEPPWCGDLLGFSGYVEQLNEKIFPELANNFLCKAFIDEDIEDYAAAAWDLIHAAWVCDDEAKAELARICRNEAIDMINKIFDSGQQFTDEARNDVENHDAVPVKEGEGRFLQFDRMGTAILVDLLRRTGRGSEAQKLIKAKRTTITDTTICKILDFQEHLLSIGDEACHTIGEALGEKADLLTHTSADMPDDLVVSDPEETPVDELESTEEVTKCAVCGTEAKYTYMRSASKPWCRSAVRATETEHTHKGSSIRFGSPDLDNRPPEPERSAISTWVHRCPSCGYCASAVDVFIPFPKEIVRQAAAAYVEQLSDPTFPELANRFMCKAMITNRADGDAQEAWAFIHAAWVCDDAAQTEHARMCRIKAADRIDSALNTSRDEHLTDDDELDRVIQVDVLRRAGRAAEARRVIEERIAWLSHASIYFKVMAFERYLLNIGDEACHTVSEALDENGVWLADTSDDMSDDLVVSDPEETPVDEQVEEEFELTEEDEQAIELAKNVARRFLALPQITPQQIVGLGNALYALERLPLVTPGVCTEFGTVYGDGNDEFYEKTIIDFSISEHTFEISKTGHVYEKAVGGDNWSQQLWVVEFGSYSKGKCDLFSLEESINSYLDCGAKISVDDNSTIEYKSDI
jgi:hypothetical protein